MAFPLLTIKKISSKTGYPPYILADRVDCCIEKGITSVRPSPKQRAWAHVGPQVFNGGVKYDGTLGHMASYSIFLFIALYFCV